MIGDSTEQLAAAGTAGRDTKSLRPSAAVLVVAAAACSSTDSPTSTGP